MPTIPSTTLTQLESALRALIDGIAAPTLVNGQTYAWQYAEDRDMPSSTMVPRLYSFEWGEPTVVQGGATGNADTEVGIVLSIIVDYRALPERDIAFIVEADHWDLHDEISDAWSQDEITGLTFSESRGFDTEDAQRVTHTFGLQYMRARRS